MLERQYYSSGEFARKAHVTLRTLRYYDKVNLLRPSAKTPSGARLYTDEDLVRLQQILLFKFFGFSLSEIRELSYAAEDSSVLLQSMRIQRKLLSERAEEIREMQTAMDETIQMLEEGRTIEWSSMLNLIHLTSMEESLKTQYVNTSNIAARIRLHRDYSVNREGWFPWIFNQCELKDGMRVLEVGCGNGALWIENENKIPKHISIELSDKSEGMIRAVQRDLGNDPRFSFRVFDTQDIPEADGKYDLVIAGHVLFYCENVSRALQEITRVLTSGGRLVAATYGEAHMHEVTDLVQEFDPEIVLSAEHLYKKFGLENGASLMMPYFKDVICNRYEDAIEISEAEPLIAYILSCHGNQNRLLLNRYREFRDFVMAKVNDGFHITKDAGVIIGTKE
jgi:DNA-binding transcriptional MerR regulator/ubiquinone/menaquinone biosynthesis C-methylase UbiE